MHAGSILIVDDEKLIRWSLKQRLQREGFTVVVADSGRETLERLDVGIALVVLDLNLPDVKDLALLREIRQRVPGARVVMMTAHWTPEIAREAREMGVGSSRVDLQACKLEYSIVSPK